MQIKINGDPIAWERMGVNYKARRIYDQQKDIREYVKSIICFQIKKKIPADVPVLAICRFFVRRMKNDSSKYPTSIKYGDLDNFQKFVYDCCNKIAYADDSQIIKITAEKDFADKWGVEPHSEIDLLCAK